MGVFVRRDPILWIYTILVVILIPVTFVVIYHVQSSNRSMDKLPSIPSKEALIELTQRFDEKLGQPKLNQIYQAIPELASGLIVVYQVYDKEHFRYTLAVVRHDIACLTCNDLLVTVFLEAGTHAIKGIVPIASWESKDVVIDPTEFLAQFVGHPVQESLHLEQNVDGMTGATYTVNALVERLNELGKWVGRYPSGKLEN